MGRVKFFTIQYCPGSMCDLPHTSEVTGKRAGINDGSLEIGTIIRKYFPKDGAVRGDHIKAWFPKQHLPGICFEPEPSRPGPATA